MEEPAPRFFSDIFPENHADLSWVPDRMDVNSSYRLAVRVGAYVKLTDDDGCEYCKAINIPKILDRDSTNWNDLLLEIATEIKLGSKQKLRVTYWDNSSRSYEEIDSDQKLLNAIDMYWEGGFRWVKDRVLDWLAKDNKIGAKELKRRLEEQYHLKLSYWVVWDGRNKALEQLKGKWDDSFECIFSFKAEVEKTNPGSLVDIEYEKVGKKMRFTRMFVALKSCVDGFVNGCRPFLDVDSTHLTGKWKGQGCFQCVMVCLDQRLLTIGNGFLRDYIKLVISTDAGKGIDSAVTKVFENGVEHRECMRHLGPVWHSSTPQ